MQQIVNFLIKYRNLLLFLFLFAVAMVFTIQSHNYHRNSFISSSNNLTGSILATRGGVSGYFDLAEENKKLQRENAALRMKLLQAGDTLLGEEFSMKFGDSLPYRIIPARVVKNSYAKRDNYITIDVGTNQGVETDMGVFTSNGVVGIVDKSDKRFSRVASILNTQLSISAAIKNTSTIGSLKWDGQDPYLINMEDVPRLAKVNQGDTIVTGKLSTIFPPDIFIGTIEKTELVGNGGRYEIKVRLNNDMTDLGHAYVVKNRDRELIRVIDTLGFNE
ncbi:MAG: rod shape-determining protein MreC [Nonlabens sp.]